MIKPYIEEEAMRYLKITQPREEAKDSTTQKRDTSCSYSLRENPKKKTHKSPEAKKKILFQCDECGKGFQNEKSFTNHQEVMHLSKNQQVYKESIDSLFKSFSLVTKKKRSSLSRHKRTSFSCLCIESRSVVAENDEELEVADCLILLSKGTPKVLDGLKLAAESRCLRNTSLQIKDGEFESGVLNNGQRLLEEEVTTPVTFKAPMNLLGHMCVLDEQNLQKGGEFGSGSSTDQKLMEETWKDPASVSEDKQEQCKAGDFEYGYCRTELGVEIMECTDSDIKKTTESDEKNVEDTIVSQENKHGQCKAGDFEYGYCRTELGVGIIECTDSNVKKTTESDEKNVEHTIVSQENKHGQCKADDFEYGYCRTELGVGTMECTDSNIKKMTESDKKNVEHTIVSQENKHGQCKAGDFEYGYCRTELEVGAMECTDSDIKKTTESDEKNVEHCIVPQENKHGQCKAGDFESECCRTELGVGVGTMENTDSDVKMSTVESYQKNVEDESRLCKKIFPSYHQTFHRMRKCKDKKEESVEPDDESVRCSVTKRRREHHCSISSRNLSSVHALGEVSQQKATL